ncbi:choloylglycine hydrolase family protein [Solidesulfovibrio sp.]|uniref:choloylglycine hydrolase family protein n=1 Tax=Solidesulfovibrio sp. TaxID=2910990 RepID=UPI0026045ECE|nr:choloylglycine hydrolase family protein [Solidesulfovibrio sp.]
MRRCFVVPFFALCLLAFAWSAVLACTSVRVKTSDGLVFYARTMEGEWTLQTVLGVVPKGTPFVGTLPDGGKGVAWKNRYAFVGMFDFGMPLASDGMNEKGLVVGQLFLPGYASYEPFERSKAGRTLAQYEFGTWLLSNFASVAEVRKGYRDVRVCQGPVGDAGPLPLHYVVHDPSGDCVVIEYTAGKVAIYDNPLGVMTNSPTFDWMLTNLDNYISLSVMNTPEKKLGGVTLKQFGQGTGLYGLPGDYSPPSRFVRMVALSQAALPAKGATAGLNQAITILDNVDIPLGAVRGWEGKQERFDKTIWSVVADTAELRYYYRSMDNKNWRYVDVAKAVANAKGIESIPVFIPVDYPDTTAQAKPFK